MLHYVAFTFQNLFNPTEIPIPVISKLICRAIVSPHCFLASILFLIFSQSCPGIPAYYVQKTQKSFEHLPNYLWFSYEYAINMS